MGEAIRMLGAAVSRDAGHPSLGRSTTTASRKGSGCRTETLCAGAEYRSELSHDLHAAITSQLQGIRTHSKRIRHVGARNREFVVHTTSCSVAASIPSPLCFCERRDDREAVQFRARCKVNGVVVVDHYQF